MPLGMVALGLLAGVLAAACDRDPKRPPDGIQVGRRATVALIALPAAEPLGRVLAGGALRFARDVPSVRVEVLDPADTSLGARLDALESVLSKPLDAACLYLTSDDVRHGARRLRERLARINDRGTPIITIGTRIRLDRIAGHVGVHLPDAAMLVGERLAELAAPGRTFVLVHNDSRGALEADAAQRLRSAAATHPRLVLLKEADGDTAGATSRDVITDLLALFGHAALVVTLDPSPWLDAPLDWERSLRESNSAARFVTLSAGPQLWRRLGTPTEPGFAAGMVGPLDGELAYEAVHMAVELISGERRGPPDRRVEVELVTAATLPDFARRYSDAAGGLDLSRFLPRGVTTRQTRQP